jgi:hypothetical protein
MPTRLCVFMIVVQSALMNAGKQLIEHTGSREKQVVHPTRVLVLGKNLFAAVQCTAPSSVMTLHAAALGEGI